MAAGGVSGIKKAGPGPQDPTLLGLPLLRATRGDPAHTCHLYLTSSLTLCQLPVGRPQLEKSLAVPAPAFLGTLQEPAHALGPQDRIEAEGRRSVILDHGIVGCRKHTTAKDGCQLLLVSTDPNRATTRYCALDHRRGKDAAVVDDCQPAVNASSSDISERLDPAVTELKVDDLISVFPLKQLDALEDRSDQKLFARQGVPLPAIILHPVNGIMSCWALDDEPELEESCTITSQ